MGRCKENPGVLSYLRLWGGSGYGPPPQTAGGHLASSHKEPGEQAASVWSPSPLEAPCSPQPCSIFTRDHCPLPNPKSSSHGWRWGAVTLTPTCHHRSTPCNVSDKQHVHSVSTAAGPPGGLSGIAHAEVQLPGSELLRYLYRCDFCLYVCLYFHIAPLFTETLGTNKTTFYP